eukprot:g15018.t1
MAGTGGCDWINRLMMCLMIESTSFRFQEAKAEAAEAAAQKAKVEDLTGKLVTVQAQLATKNLQLQEPSTTGPLLSTQPVTSFQAEKRPSEALSAPPGLFLKSETCRQESLRELELLWYQKIESLNT